MCYSLDDQPFWPEKGPRLISLVFNPFGPQKEKFQEFLERYVDSFIAWDLLIFFFHNPSSCDSADNIAARLGRTKSDIVPSLEKMVSNSLLDKKLSFGEEVYFYAASKELSERIKEFIDALESREKRLVMLTHVLQKEAACEKIRE